MGFDDPIDNAKVVFQSLFSATCVTIVSGAIAERANIWAYVIYSMTASVLIFPVVARWVWGENGIFSPMAKKPLQGCGGIDIAGSGVVHLSGGLMALIAADMIGPRLSLVYGKGPILRDAPLKTITGGVYLFTAWIFFNSGSVGKISQKLTATSTAFMTTFVAGSVACMSALILDSLAVKQNRWMKLSVRFHYNTLSDPEDIDKCIDECI